MTFKLFQSCSSVIFKHGSTVQIVLIGFMIKFIGNTLWINIIHVFGRGIQNFRLNFI